ncbi:MAG: acyl-CoA dehydrogenase family protein [Actinomycetota bacterium]|nr:acyl-CoA dehydrogenase family protein [Actinomycetota bacterium]
MTISPAEHPTRPAEDFIVWARENRPWLRENEAEAERQRRVPQQNIEELDGAGFFSLTTPARFGGADLSTRELHDIYRSLASGCGATAWVLWAAAGGNLWSYAFGDDVMASVYETPWVGNRTFALGGASRRMSGKARPVEDGWMIEGVWPFATGSVHASHGYLAAVYDDADDSKVGMALVPKDQLVVRGEWDAMGLAATGSQTVATKGELFIPGKHFSTPGQLRARLEEATGQGAGPRRGGLVRSVVTGTGLALGMADHAMEVYLDAVGTRSLPYSRYAQAVDAPQTHHAVGLAHMRIRAAGTVADAAVCALDICDLDQRDLTAREGEQFHTDVAHVWHECADAVEGLFKASGASAIAKHQPLQLIARNCRAGSLHAAYNIDTWLENIGRSLCGSESAEISTSVLEQNN